MIRRFSSLFSNLFIYIVLPTTIIWVILWGYQFDKIGFTDYFSPQTPNGVTFERAKTLWDWLGLVAVPLLLTFGALVVSNSNQSKLKAREELQTLLEKEKADNREKFEKWMAYDRAREQGLQEFFISIETLILQHGLKKSKLKSPVREVARARTLDILRRLDGERKRLVLDFLFQTGLINIQNPLISLNFAGFDNFSQHPPHPNESEQPMPDYFLNVERTANLEGIYLSDVQLHEVNFNSVNLNRAILRNVDLTESRMENVDLRHVDIKDVKFVGAKLYHAKMHVAKLVDVNFEKASLNNAHLEEAWLENINFRNADLKHVNFRKANLSNVDFRDADTRDVVFDDTDLRSCKITKEQWVNVMSHVGTIQPDKFW